MFWLALAGIATDTYGSGRTIENAVGNFIHAVVFGILPLWLVLRLADRVSGARRHRKEVADLKWRVEVLEERNLRE